MRTPDSKTSNQLYWLTGCAKNLVLAIKSIEKTLKFEGILSSECSRSEIELSYILKMRNHDKW